MKKEIIVAIIGAVTTILAPVITIAVTDYYESKPYKELVGARAAIEGRWKGSIMQLVFGQEKEIPIEFNFKTSGKSILGESNIIYDEQLIPLIVKGYFPVDRYILLNYRNKSDIKLQFGSIAAGLNASANKLQGRFVGYGHINDALVEGTITLNKQVN